MKPPTTRGERGNLLSVKISLKNSLTQELTQESLNKLIKNHSTNARYRRLGKNMGLPSAKPLWLAHKSSWVAHQLFLPKTQGGRAPYIGLEPITLAILT